MISIMWYKNNFTSYWNHTLIILWNDNFYILCFLSSFDVFLYNSLELYRSGDKNVKESPKRADAFKSKLENAGGRLIETYYTFGKYDGVSIVEAPDDEILMSCLLSIGSQGNAPTVTLKAFTYADATKIIGSTEK